MICSVLCRVRFMKSLFASQVAFTPFLGPCGVLEISVSCTLKEGQEAMKRKRYTEDWK